MSWQQKLILISTLIFCVLVQITPVIKSGLHYNFGIGFWGPSGHDSVWHLSLIRHINNPLIIDMPVYAGEKLFNYHPFFNILISYLAKITCVNDSLLLFQIYPILSSIIFLYLSFKLGKLITKSFTGGLFLLLINSLSNSFGWLISIFKYGNFSGESMFWAMQSPSNQINQPFSLSLIFLLALLLILFNSQNFKLSILNKLFVFLILIILPITKSYSAVVGFGIFSLFSIYSYYKNKELVNLILFIISLTFSYFIFSLYSPNSSDLLVFRPFWFLETLIDSTDKLYWPKMSSFRNTLMFNTVIDIRLLFIYLSLFLIFIIGNFSWRLLGIFNILKSKIFLDKIILFIITILIIIPTLFIQKGTSWNTIQFLYYALFLSNIYLAKYLTSIFPKLMGKLLILIIIFSYIFAFLGMAPNYLDKTPPASLPDQEFQALNYLSNQSKGVVLTVPYDQYLKQKFIRTPIPLYAYETTSYVSAYSRQQVFLEDEMNVNNSGYDYIGRKKESIKFFNQLNIFQDRGFLVNNKIDYIYIAGIQKNIVKLNESNLFLKRIFENQDALIYRVQR